MMKLVETQKFQRIIKKQRRQRWRDHAGSARQPEVNETKVLLNQLRDKKVDVKVLTKSLDASFANVLKESNERNQMDARP